MSFTAGSWVMTEERAKQERSVQKQNCVERLRFGNTIARRITNFTISASLVLPYIALSPERRPDTLSIYTKLASREVEEK